MVRSLIPFAVAFALTVSAAGAEEWYAGGTLHNATLGDWADASRHNRLATAADFAATILEERISSISDLETPALQMEACITEAARERSTAAIQVSEVGAACAVLLGWR